MSNPQVKRHWITQLAASLITAGNGPVAVVEQVDAARFFALLRETLGWEGV